VHGPADVARHLQTVDPPRRHRCLVERDQDSQLAPVRPFLAVRRHRCDGSPLERAFGPASLERDPDEVGECGRRRAADHRYLELELRRGDPPRTVLFPQRAGEAARRRSDARTRVVCGAGDLLSGRPR
jgi:hypothetical protein